MSSLTSTVKGVLRKAGIEVHRYVPGSSPGAQITSALRHFGIDLVLDVGANAGQFASEIRSGGYPGRIVSFEPLSEPYIHLCELSASDSAWLVHPRSAIGDRDGEVEINVSANSVSSSILPMMRSHEDAAPQSVYTGKQAVPISRLDSVAEKYLEGTSAPFLKIDTQGYEWHVMDGATNTLGRCKGVLLELSMVPLYEGQHLWQDTIERLAAAGFVLWGLQPGFTDARTGRTLQADGIFFRN